MRYLVTGGAGFIGSNLCHRLLDDGHSVACLDDLSTGRQRNIKDILTNSKFEFFNHDLTKPFFPDRIDAIFNLACPASPVHYQYNPIRTLKMGTLAMYNVLGMATRFNVPILQASTSEVYGDPKEHPQSESYWGHVNPVGPRACYDESKRLAETISILYFQQYQVPVKIARPFNVYGPYLNLDDGRIIPDFMSNAMKNSEIVIHSDGTPTRSFCYASDAITAFFKLLFSDHNGIAFNVGNDEEISVKDVADMIQKIMEKPISIKMIKSNDPNYTKDNPQRRCPDLSLIKSSVNYTPKINFEEGLKRIYEWYKGISE